MNLGQFRKATENMPDDAPFILHMVSCPQDDLNVVVESIAPNAAKDRVDIHVSIVTDDELREDEDDDEGDGLKVEEDKLLYFVPDSVADAIHRDS